MTNARKLCKIWGIRWIIYCTDYVLELAKNGELFEQIQRVSLSTIWQDMYTTRSSHMDIQIGRYKLDAARFYAAELVRDAGGRHAIVS